MRIWRALAAIILLSFALIGCAVRPTATPVPSAARPAGGLLSGAPTAAPTLPSPTSAPTATVAQDVAQVAFQAEPEQVAVSKLVTLRLMAADASDLYGTQVVLRFDPSAAQIQDANASMPGIQVTPGQTFPTASSFVALNEADAAQGVLEFAVTLLNPAEPLQGDVELLAFDLVPLKSGEIRLELAQVLMANRDGQPLPVEFESLVLQVE